LASPAPAPRTSRAIDHRQSPRSIVRRLARAPESSAPAEDSGARANRRTIERGDCLWSIARDVLGAGAGDAKVAAKVSELWDLNDTEVIRTGDRDLIYPGQELRLR